jgi:hypothetical protein
MSRATDPSVCICVHLWFKCSYSGQSPYGPHDKSLRRRLMMHDVVFLFDVDNTLLNK